MRALTLMRGWRARPVRPWLPILIGLLALYIPTYLDLAEVFWKTRDGSYGAVMFVLVLWLIWRERTALRYAEAPANRAAGAALLSVGLLLYTLGRSQFFYQLEIGSQIPVLFGIALLFLRRTAVRRLALPILMLLFVVPVPGSLADQFLLPLKELVSRIVDDTLHWAGYPIARNGVVLSIGPYSLLIADACSGLNSMVALSGIGLIYVHLARHTRRAVNAALLLSILPIAFLTNVLRVLVLVLITYYGGDAAGLAFHEQAGYLEIVAAFGAFFTVDFALRRTLSSDRPGYPPATLESPRAQFRASLSEPVLIAMAMLLALSAAWWLAPTPSTADVPRLAQIVPTSFQDWKEIRTDTAPVDPRFDPGATRDTSNPYDDVLMRTYANSRGDVVLLALAYGRNQHQELKIHRPELCYVAQGFSVLSRGNVTFPTAASDLPVHGERMLVQAAGRLEAVSYWIRIGGLYSRSAWATRYYIFAQGLKRRELDGILVRVSQILDTPASVSDRRFRLQEQFVADLVRAMPADARHLLIVGSRA